MKAIALQNIQRQIDLMMLRHTLQGCNDGESMRTCVNLTDSKIELRLQRKKVVKPQLLGIVKI